MVKKKYVIYTIITGKYNEVLQPLCTDDRFDYVLFSNDFKESQIGVWQIRNIPKPAEIEPSDNKRLSRYPKSHPETMLSEYKASLYMDANVQIADQWVYDRVVELSEKNVDYAGIKLIVSDRDDIYRHSYDICMVCAENDVNAIEEMHALYKDGYPEHYGLNENNIIFRKHTDKMKAVDELWWKWIVNYSFRDQFSFMYSLWKYNIPIVYFLPQGEDSRNSDHFKYIVHNTNPNVARNKWVRQGVLEKLRNKCRKLSDYHRERYCRQWVRICKMPHPKQALVVCGLFATIINIPLILINVIKKIKK